MLLLLIRCDVMVNFGRLHFVAVQNHENNQSFFIAVKNCEEKVLKSWTATKCSRPTLTKTGRLQNVAVQLSKTKKTVKL